MTHEYTYEGKAMGTEFSLALVGSDASLAETYLEEAVHTISVYEKQFSRFLEDSELSLINTKKDMVVSANFLEVLLCAQDLFSTTKGAFNPLVQIERFGYRNYINTLSPSEIPIKEESVSEETYNIDFSSLSIEITTRRVVLQEGQRLDFGGFLKGYVAEYCARTAFAHNTVSGVIVNMGGDIFTMGEDAKGNPFVFSIFNPHTHNDEMSLPLHNESLATSGTYKRKWEYAGHSMHHILDVSGQKNPETNIISASVLAPHGALAEAYTKMLLSLGYQKTCTLLGEEAPRCILIMNDGTIETHV